MGRLKLSCQSTKEEIMKKTISINLRGFHFIIEEDAYEKLQEYLEKLESTLGETEGKQEIVEDIETRMAELFLERKEQLKKEVIEETDVLESIETLGQPEDFIDEEAESGSNTHTQHPSGSTDKKLFRDLENANIAGVCAGLANYFNMDVMIVRLIFIFIVLFAGFGIPLYIILWIVLPKANSNIDRLRMHGIPVTVENVREEVEAAAQRMSKNSKKFAKKLERESNWQDRFATLGRVFSVGFGLFALFLAVMFTIAYVVLIVGQVGVTPIHGSAGLFSLHEFANVFFEDDFDLKMLWWTGSIVSITTIAFLVIAGVKSILNIQTTWFKYFARTYVGVIIAGIVMCFYFGSILGREFAIKSEIEKPVAVQMETLKIFVQYGEQVDQNNVHNEDIFWMAENNGMLEEDGLRLRTVPSLDSLFHVRVVMKARGNSQEEAYKNVRDIRYTPSVSGDTVTLPSFYSFPIEDKYRDQRVRVIVEVPEGKEVQFLNSRYREDYNEYRDYRNNMNDYWLDGHYHDRYHNPDWDWDWDW